MEVPKPSQTAPHPMGMGPLPTRDHELAELGVRGLHLRRNLLSPRHSCHPRCGDLPAGANVGGSGGPDTQPEDFRRRLRRHGDGPASHWEADFRKLLPSIRPPDHPMVLTQKPESKRRERPRALESGRPGF